MIQKGLPFVFEPFLKGWKSGQNRPKGYGVSLYFLLDNRNIFNFLKPIKKA